MQYSEETLRHICAEYLRSDAHWRLTHDLSTSWSHEAHGPRHYAKLYEDTSVTLWLLGWRPGVDNIDIHGHGVSAALITCLRGAVDEIDYGFSPIAWDEPECYAARVSFPTKYKSSVCRAGQSIYLPVGSLHEMRCNESSEQNFSLTLHAYSPRLSVMTYFAREQQLLANGAPHRLTYVGCWLDAGETVPRKRGP